MKSRLLIILLFLTACYDENKQPHFIGKWSLEVIEGVSYVECPDVIKIESDNKYKVFNECYGIGKEKLVEEGDWIYNETENSLIFINRFSTTNYTPYGLYDHKCKIIILTKEILKWESETEDGSIIETFKRNEPNNK